MSASWQKKYLKNRDRLVAQWDAVAASTTFRFAAGLVKYAAHIHETSLGNTAALGTALVVGIALGTDVAHEFGLNARMATMVGVAGGVVAKSALSYAFTAPGRAWKWMRGKNSEP